MLLLTQYKALYNFTEITEIIDRIQNNEQFGAQVLI